MSQVLPRYDSERSLRFPPNPLATCLIANDVLTHHIPSFDSRYRPSQIPLRDIKPLYIRCDILDDGFCLGSLLSNDIDLLYELLERRSIGTESETARKGNKDRSVTDPTSTGQNHDVHR